MPYEGTVSFGTGTRLGPEAMFQANIQNWCLNQLGIIPIEKIDVIIFEFRETFPMDHEKYDLVICTEVLEHLKDRNDTQRDIFNFSGALNLVADRKSVV